MITGDFILSDPLGEDWWWTSNFMVNLSSQSEGIRQYDSSDTGQIRPREHRAEHQEPAEVLCQLDDTSNSPVYGEYKCC